NFEGGVVLFEGGMDPADMVNSGNADEVERLFSSPIPFAKFVIERTVASFKTDTPRGREEAFNAVKSFLKKLSTFMQEEYAPYAASLLGVNSARLVSKSSADMPGNSRESLLTLSDIAEKSIIKTLIKTPTLIDTVLDVMDSSMFLRHKEAFESLVRGEESSELLQIEFDESIQIYSENELKKQLIYFLIKYYQRALDNIKKYDKLSIEKKIFYIRKYRNYLDRLKRGELVPYESDSTL
ncbi:MAG: DNA primase, partial [Hydrogenimonas sp.]|nr:DNA primase [Hydrogenimonas sp.]